MNDRLEINCINTGSVHYYAPGTTLMEIYKDIKPQLKSFVIAALVNNELKELAYKVYNPKYIRFVDLSHPDGMRTYIRSMTFLLQVAVKEVLPGYKLTVDFPISKGLYCGIHKDGICVNKEQIEMLECKMKELVEKNLPFEKNKIPTKQAIELFRKEGYDKKALLLETRGKFYVSTYLLDGHADNFYGPLMYSTKHLNNLDLKPYYQGVLLRLPVPGEPNKLQPVIDQSKMLQVFKEQKDWNEILGMRSVGSINKTIQNGGAARLIQINEALHERKYAEIADKVAANRNIKIILISGPSSSGKTTSAKRIGNQLKVNKLNPVIIELDNYFVDREFTPKDANGDYDFESLHAVNLKLFNQQITDLLAGKKVIIPKFDFKQGKSFFLDENALQMAENDTLIIEGIHGLNPELIEGIDHSKVFRVYVSALTSVSLDENNRISTTDNRLIRRIVRDAETRGYTATDTISRWQSVRRGEDNNIFPYQENADYMLNSSLIYELSVLRKHVEPLLRKVQPTHPEFAEALRLLKFISYFQDIDWDEERNIPPTSVLREFIGGSSFTY